VVAVVVGLVAVEALVEQAVAVQVVTIALLMAVLEQLAQGRAVEAQAQVVQWAAMAVQES
jgi:hypothetical protein